MRLQSFLLASTLLLTPLALSAENAPVLEMATETPKTTETPTTTEAEQPKPMEQAFAILDDESLSLADKRTQLQALVNANPNSGEIWSAYGEVLEELGEVSTAIMAYEKATQIDRNLYTPWFRLGLIKKRGNPEPNLKAAEQYFQEALRAGAPKARTLNELAVSVALQNRLEDSIPYWEQAIAEDPDWGVLYNNLLRAATRLNREDLADRYINGAITAERFEEAAVMLYGEYLISRRNTTKAVDVYTRAVNTHPTNARLQYYRGMALYEAGRSDDSVKALEDAKRIAEEEGSRSDVIQSVEWALFRIKHPRDEREFQKVKDLVFGSETDRRRQERNLRQAIKIVDPLVKKHPTFWNGYFIRGVAHRRLNEPEKARADYEAVRNLYPNEPNVMMELALLTRDELKFDEAADLADQAVALAPRDPAFAVNAGFINVDAGRCARAWELYRIALRMVGPDNVIVLKEELDIRCPGGDANSSEE